MMFSRIDRRFRARLSSLSLLGTVLLLGAVNPTPARADDDNAFGDVETTDIFGFTSGSGVGLQGEKEFEIDTVGNFGKRDGRYATSETKLTFETTPTQFIQVEFAALVSGHSIRDVTGRDDSSGVDFRGLSGELRYLALERTSSQPLSVTLSVEPEWHRVSSAGERENALELETKLNADLEVVPNRMYVAFNALYEPEWTRTIEGEIERESTLGVSGAVAYRITPPLFLGAEVWYLRHYDGAGFNTFTGDAVFVGPTLYYQLTNKTFIAAAWGTQVAGRDVDDPRSLNLSEFSRQRGKLKLAIEF